MSPAQQSDSSTPLGLSAATPLPVDPEAILKLAAATNGLVGPNVQPWHIKASYQIFDRTGAPLESGNYEEWWVSDTRYKRSYTSTKFTQTDYATDRGLYRIGDQNWPSFLERSVRNYLIQPIPTETNAKYIELERTDRPIGNVQFQCVTLKQRKTDFATNTVTDFCFSQNQPALRVSSWGNQLYDALYNDIVVFQGRLLARDIRVTNQGKPCLNLHVDLIEHPSSTNEFDMAEPSDAAGPLGGKVIDSGGMMRELLLKSATPDYPAIALVAHVSGTVVTKVTIGTNGRVSAGQVVSGPPMLNLAALDCVKKWQFRPFMILGAPAELETEIGINFSLNNR